MPLVFVAALVLGLTMAAALLGVHIGWRLRSGLTDPERSQLFGIQASLLGLLALLLGFSFAMGEARYNLRKQLVLDEANAIGTARLRAATVPDEPGAEIERLLKQYVDERLAMTRARSDAEVSASLAASERLQGEVWSRAASLAKRDPRSIPAGLLLQSLNEMIDLHTLRLGAARNHIPTIVLVALVVVAMAAMGWLGAGLGCSGRRGKVTTLLVAALITFVIAVIVDLDQPRVGLIRVSQAAMLELQRTFQ